MFYALITPFFLAWSALLGAKAQAAVGAPTAFAGRTIIAFSLLAVYALIWGDGYQGPGMTWLFIGGLLGFGLGDLCLFTAYARLGARITLLLWQSVAAPLSCLLEWIVLGALPSLAQLGGVLIILAGICLALDPAAALRQTTGKRLHFISGIIAAIGAAFGQAMGTVASRYAYALNSDAGITIDGMTAAFQRIHGGVCVAIVVFFWIIWRSKSTSIKESSNVKGWCYVAANALCGPVLAIGCFQSALMHVTSTIAVVLSATSPIVILPFTWWLTQDRPSRVVISGSILASVGVILLIILH